MLPRGRIWSAETGDGKLSMIARSYATCPGIGGRSLAWVADRAFAGSRKGDDEQEAEQSASHGLFPRGCLENVAADVRRIRAPKKGAA